MTLTEGYLASQHICNRIKEVFGCIKQPAGLRRTRHRGIGGVHEVIQAAMGWLDYHLWECTIGQRRFGLPMDEDWGTEAAKMG